MVVATRNLRDFAFAAVAAISPWVAGKSNAWAEGGDAPIGKGRLGNSRIAGGRGDTNDTKRRFSRHGGDME